MAKDLAKRYREARKAGLLELESPDASIKEEEGAEDSHWLNELLEEEEEEFLADGGLEAPARGHRFLGLQRAPPLLLLTRAGMMPPRGVRQPPDPRRRQALTRGRCPGQGKRLSKDFIFIIFLLPYL